MPTRLRAGQTSLLQLSHGTVTARRCPHLQGSGEGADGQGHSWGVVSRTTLHVLCKASWTFPVTPTEAEPPGWTYHGGGSTFPGQHSGPQHSHTSDVMELVLSTVAAPATLRTPSLPVHSHLCPGTFTHRPPPATPGPPLCPHLAAQCLAHGESSGGLHPQPLGGRAFLPSPPVTHRSCPAGHQGPFQWSEAAPATQLC